MLIFCIICSASWKNYISLQTLLSHKIFRGRCSSRAPWGRRGRANRKNQCEGLNRHPPMRRKRGHAGIWCRVVQGYSPLSAKCDRPWIYDWALWRISKDINMWDGCGEPAFCLGQTMRTQVLLMIEEWLWREELLYCCFDKGLAVWWFHQIEIEIKYNLPCC